MVDGKSMKRLAALTRQLAAQPQTWSVLSSPWPNADYLLPPEAREQQHRQRTLERYLSSYPHFADAPRWRQEHQTIAQDLETLAAARAAELAAHGERTMQALRDHGYHDVTAIDQTEWRGATGVFFTALREPRGLDMKLPGKWIRVKQDAFQFGALRPKDARDLPVKAAEGFRQLVGYLQMLHIGRELEKKLSEAHGPKGFIAQIAAATDGKKLHDALEQANRKIGFGFVRAVLAAMAYWKNDRDANVIIEALDPLLRGYKPSGGLRGPCPEQDYIGFIATLSKQDLPAFDHARASYYVSMTPVAPSEKNDPAAPAAIMEAIDAINKQANALGHDLKNPDFQEQLALWQGEIAALQAQLDVRENNKGLITAFAAAVEGRVRAATEDGTLVIQWDRDVRVENNRSSFNFHVTAKKEDADRLAKVLQDWHPSVHRNGLHWDFIRAVNGEAIAKNDYIAEIPGVREMGAPAAP